MTTMIVTHEIVFARDVAKEIVFMDHGRMIERGEPRRDLGAPSTEGVRSFLRVSASARATR